MRKKNERQQNVEAVHTHTHTHTRKFSEKRKVIVVGVGVAIVTMVAMVVMAIQLCMKKEIIGENVLAGNSEPIKVADVGGSEDNEIQKENSADGSISSETVTTNLEDVVKPKAMVDTSKWDTSKVTVYTDKSGNKAPIPVGYVASQVIGETEINTGLVIYEGTTPVTGTAIGVPGTPAWTASCERNQWVWVPVPDVDRIYDKSTGKSKLYERTQTGRGSNINTSKNYEPGILTKYDNERYFSQYNLSGMTKKKLLYELETELDETIKSIEKYGGFYIGRYETGKVTKRNSTRYVKPVIQRIQGEMSINYVTWYDSYINLKTLGVNENVKSNMIYGCLWDETLQWFRESGAKTDAELYNSLTWGNYGVSNSFTYYTNVSGSVGTKSSKTIIPTGSTERNKANNIYDMAGNVREWTMEGNGGNTGLWSRKVRGSYFETSTTSDGTSGAGHRYYEYPYSNGDHYDLGQGDIRCACVYVYKIEILRV